MTAEPADTLIAGGLVVTLDGDRRLIEDGAVAVRGSRIAAVGPAAEIGTRFTAREVIDAGGRIVMPGLINAHTHAGDSLFRGLFEDLPLEPWLERLWVVERRFLRPDTVRIGARLAFAEMIRAGITTALDMFWHPEAGAAAARELGLRLMTGPIYFDGDAPDGIAQGERTARGRELLRELAADPLLHPCVLPHSTYTVSPASLAEARDLAAELGVPLSTHASETAAEVGLVADRHGRRPPGHLDRLGMLNGSTVLAHGVHLEPEEMDLLAARGTTVAHCPLSNLKLGSGIAPVPEMRAAGVGVALGTDGPVSSNDLDLWPVLRLSALLAKGTHRDPSLLPARDVLAYATRDAASALGLGDEIGTLEPGKRADLILIDADRTHLTPLYDVYSHLIYAAGRADVETVMIHGRVVMRDRELLSVDEGRAIEDVRELAREIAASTAP